MVIIQVVTQFHLQRLLLVNRLKTHSPSLQKYLGVLTLSFGTSLHKQTYTCASCLLEKALQIIYFL